MIRGGLVAAEDDSNLDTSIACDSCDLWYHAICVGFNPEITSEDSWLCPRCLYTEAKNKSDVILKQSISEDSDRTSADASFSGRASVSVADDGETALVVSMVGVDSESKDDLLEGNSDKSSEINLVGMVSSELTQRSSELSPIREEIALPRNSNEKSPVIKSAQLSSAAGKVARLADIDMINTDTIQQVNNDQDTQVPPMQDRHNTSDLESGSEISHPAKKASLEVPEQEMHLIANSDVSSTDCHTTSIAAKAVVSDTSNIVTQDKCIPDIMSIVEGDSYMRDPGRELAKPVGRRAGDKPGLRMKKIFHKDGKESSVVVQKLQQEIREVVRDNGIGILEKDNAFDEKLLTAFRAAIGKSVDGPDKRPNSSLLRKSLLQKGKIRENLTKKLKNASSIASKGQEEGTDDLSRNYPLLAKFPVDMRPQLTAVRHNKVPMSVRQAQLYRIAEHYLQRANLDVIRKCADTELAIADAINVENDIYGKSSSKSVYVNLCSQATRQSAEAKPQNDASTLTEKTGFSSDPVSQQIGTENTSISSSDVEEALGRAGLLDLPATDGQADSSGVPEQNMNEDTASFNSVVEEALKRAGLFDSPPNSPDRKVTTAEGNSSTVSDGPVIAQQKDTSAEDTCLVGLDSGPSKSCDSRVRDASSSLKDDDGSSVQVPDDANCQSLCTTMSCQELKCNSEEDQKSAIPSGEATGANETSSANLAEADGHDVACEETSQTDKGAVVETPDPEKPKGMNVATSDSHNQSRHGNSLPQEGEATRQPVKLEPSSSKEKSRSDSQESKSKRSKGGSKSSTHPAAPDPGSNKDAPNSSSSVYKKVEMYVKENIRPLCKSGVITVEQYRWAVGKTAEKVMKHHWEAQNANFLIKEGDKALQKMN
ncbi:unnamed protein product [Alopecurus aequalis]